MQLQKKAHLLAATLLFAAAGPACSGSVSSGGSGGSGGGGAGGAGAGGAGGSGPTAEEACAAIASAVCQKLSDCSMGFMVVARYGDLATCEARTELGCLAGFAAPESGADPATTLACAGLIPAEACEAFFDEALPAACHPQMGARAIGEPCIAAAQCDSAYCALPDGQACGTCAPAPAPGDDCSVVPDCGYGLTCALDGTCAPFAASGAPCDASAPCGFGLSCVGGLTCQKQGSNLGDACDLQAQTAPDCNRALGLFCSPLTDTCVQAALAPGGAACGNVMGVPTGCEANGTCSAAGPMAPGSCLTAAADGDACDDDLGPKCVAPARCAVPPGGATLACILPDGPSCT